MGGPEVTIKGDPQDTHHFDPVHDQQIIQVDETVDGETRPFLAYDSDADGGEIRAYYSDDLLTGWQPYSGNPILSGSDNYRLPTTTLLNGTYHILLTN